MFYSHLALLRIWKEKLNQVSPGVKSADTAVLWFSYVGFKTNGRSPDSGSAFAALILPFAQRNRQLNVSSGRLLPLEGGRGTHRSGTPAASICGWGTTNEGVTRPTDKGRRRGPGKLLLPLRDARPTADGRKVSTCNSSVVAVPCLRWGPQRHVRGGVPRAEL